VINFDPPEDRDAYVHRVGRTGRAGRNGVGITFHSAAERSKIAGLADELGIEHSVAPGQRATTPQQRERGGTPHSGAPRSGAPRRARKPQNAASAPAAVRTRSYGRTRGR
jgi:superfamily II DNA/RNA helicase